MRPDRGFFVQARGGIGMYGGDADDTETDGNTAAGGTGETGFGEYLEDAGLAAGAELGYQFSPRLSLSLAYHYGEYPEIIDVTQIQGRLPGQGTISPTFEAIRINTNDAAHEAQLRLRILMLPRARFSPYLMLGGTAAFKTPATDDIDLRGIRQRTGQLQNVQRLDNQDKPWIAGGPMGGLGLDVRLTRHISFLIEGDIRMFFNDTGLDRLGFVPSRVGDCPSNTAPENCTNILNAINNVEPSTVEDLDFDLLGFLGGGLRYDFNAPLIPVDATIDGPTALEVNESGTYTAFVNSDASGPLTYAWDFGDGSVGEGLTASHAYAATGTYTVSFTATGPINSDTETLLVTVTDPPILTVAPVLSNCRATPNPAGIGEAVRFSASASGTDPITFRYDFGDGQTASTLNASNSYAAAGTYTATLTATNEMGSDQCTVVVTVINRRCENVTELNTVYFNYRLADLTDEGRSRLDENLAVLRECPQICVTINGYSDDREQDKVRLSERRAQSVADYYTSMGISEDRLRTRGLGEAPDANSKSDPGPGDRNARRAESIPQSCTTFMQMDN